MMEQLTWSPVLLQEWVVTEPNTDNTTSAEVSGDTAQPQRPSGGVFANSSFIWMLVFFMIVLYFFMIRPQSKRQKETQRMLASLEKGDRVVTSSGIFGMIDTVKDNSFMVTQVLEKKNPPQPEPKKSIFSGFGKKKSEKDKTDKPKTEL